MSNSNFGGRVLLEDEDFMEEEEDNNGVVPSANSLIALINEPMADTMVLKKIYWTFFHVKNAMQLSMFLSKWRKTHIPKKQQKFDSLGNRMYDSVMCDEFENFFSEGEIVQNEDGFQRLIDAQQEKYIKSCYYDNDALEKLITLTIAKEHLPINFFIGFNFASKMGYTRMISQTIDVICKMQLIGFDYEADKILLLSFL